MAIVYRHIRLDKNQPFYIGIGDSEKRAHEKIGRNKYWKHITKKTEYDVEILFTDLTWEEACEKEKEFIKLYGRKDMGSGILCNMTDGGDGTLGRIFTEDELKLRRLPYSQKYSNPNNVIELRRKKMIEFNKTYKASKETNEKISKTLIGRIITDAHREKQSLSAKKRWGNDMLKKELVEYITHNPQTKEKDLLERFNITRSFLYRTKKENA